MAPEKSESPALVGQCGALCRLSAGDPSRREIYGNANVGWQRL